MREPARPVPAAGIVVLEGGLGGVAVVRHLERLCSRHRGVEIVLVSRDNSFVLAPLLFRPDITTIGLTAQPVHAVHDGGERSIERRVC